MQLSTLSGIVALSFSVSGCSLFVGPSAFSKVYSADTKDIVSAGTDVWTNFATLPLSEASQRLTGASELFRKRALNITRARDAGSDTVAASLVAGAIAGATGSVEGARIGTGLAGILGMGVDRYKLDVQRTNLVSAAGAFGCINDSFAGLSDDDLLLRFTDDDPAVADKLNRLSRDAKILISRAAGDVRFAFEDAQAKVALKQPDVAALQQSLRKQEEVKPPPETLSALQTQGTGTNSSLLSSVQVHDQAILIKNLQASVTEKDAVITYLRKHPELHAQLAEAEKERVALLDDISRTRKNVIMYVEAQVGPPPVSDMHLRNVASRLSVLEDKLAVCRALIAK